MKKLVFTSVALFALVGSVYTVSASAPTHASISNTSKHADLPIPVCPANDPNGCGIYD